MNVTGLSWITFHLPLRSPFATASSTMNHRDGLLLRMHASSGAVGVGEASPHPEAGPDAMQELEQALAIIGSKLLDADVEHLPCLDIPPPLACAIDTAGLDLLARERGVRVASLLTDAPRTSVHVNATISTKSTAVAADEAQAAVRAGFACVKLKVGVASSVEEEAARVAAVRSAIGPDVQLRLDANGAWSVEQAIETIRALGASDIEYVEQPVDAGDLEGLRRVRRAVETPLAADESIASVDDARRVLENEAADIIVIKPMVVGGLRPAKQIIDLVAEAGAQAVVTTTIDAGVGTAAAVHLAAALPEGSPACGLATGSLLADDIVADRIRVVAGKMIVPSGPGLGVAIDAERLTKFASDERSLP